MYAASSGSNYLKTEEELDDNGSWLINIENGETTVEAQGSNTRNKLRKNNSSAIFSCYGSGQNAVSIYKYEEGGSSNPSISLTHSFVDFSYNLNNGPSAAQSFSVEGSNLTADVTVSVPDDADFELCATEDGMYSASLTFSQSEGSLASTTVYVRMKAGLDAGSHSGQITVATTGATSRTVSLNGIVVDPSVIYYTKVTEAPEGDNWTGEYLITNVNGNVVNALSGSSGTSTNYGTRLDISEYVIGNNITANATTDGIKVTARATEGGYSLYLENIGYLGWSAGNSLIFDENVTDGRNEWSISISEGAISIDNVGESTRTLRYNTGSPRFACYTGGQAAITLYKSPREVAEMIATPVFTPAAGYYEEAQSVTITCTTEGANIYYTTDETAPTNESTQYTEPIAVSQNTTIKAIAYVGDRFSNAATATYTFPVTAANIAELYTLEGTAGNITLTGDVTFVFRNGKNIYVKDVTGGLLIFDQSNKITTEYTEGDVISGGIAGTISMYHGLFEFVPASNTAASTQSTGAVAPTIITVEQLRTNEYVSQLVKVENVAVATGTTYTASQTGDNVTFSQNGSEALLRNSFKTLNMTIGDNTNWDIIGFAAIYNDDIQIYPRGNSDLTEFIPIVPAEPTFSQGTGTYYNDFELTLACETEGATIYYTLDGSDPTDASTEYNAAIAITATTTVTAIAILDGVQSGIVSETYTMATANPTFSAEADSTYYNDFELTLACETNGATIYYTLDNSNPTNASTEYTGPITITATTTIKAIAIKNDISSEIVSETYNMETAAPVFSPTTGTYTGSVEVTLTCETQGATIYYNIEPTDAQEVYTAPLTFTQTTTIYAFAEKNGVTSTVDSAKYTITNLPVVATPTIEPNGGEFETTVNVTLTCAIEDAAIFYTLNGETPTTGSTRYVGPFPLTETTTVKAMAAKEGMADSNIAEATFTKLIPVATPTINPNGGEFVNTVDVTLACETEDATIYYTTNGDEPTVTEGTLYNEPFTLEETRTVKAIAVKAGMAKSNIAEATFTKLIPVATPTIEPNGGNFEDTQVVTLACETTGASIYYTLNGTTDPTAESTLYENPFTLEATTTVRAIAMKENMQTSAIAEATFTKVEPVVTVNYTRITSLNQLQDGDKVILAARYDDDASHYYVAPTRIANKLKGVAVTTEDDVISTDVDTIVWTLKINEGLYRFVNASNDTLGFSSNSTNFSKTANKNWTISEYTTISSALVGEYAGYKIINVTDDGRVIALNHNNNDVFGAYANSNAENNNAGQYNFALDIFADMDEHAPLVATPTFSLPTGNYTTAQTVEILCATEGATIRYTLDGNDPTEESPIYETPLSINEPTTVKAKAFKEDYIASAVAEAFYNVITTPTIIVDAETLNFEDANETKTLTVSSLNLTEDITVAVTENFTVDAETITMNADTTLTITFTGNAATEGTLTLTSGETIKTVALVATPLVASEGCYYPVAEALDDWSGDYLITYTDLASETINALNGIHNNNFGTYNNVFEYYGDGVVASNLTTEVCKVTVEQTENGYSMYLNRSGYLGFEGSDNKLYSNETFTAQRDEWTFSENNGQILITNVQNPERNLKWNNNNPRFACYTTAQSPITLYKLGAIPAVATPVFTPAAGYYEEAQNVTITCSTEGATIYYTTDGTNPTAESTQYTEAIAVSENMTIKAIAVLGEDASSVATARYTFPTFVENIAALYALENTDGSYKLTGDVTFVFRKDRNMYVKDATGGLLIYDQNNKITNEYEEGDVISGGISGTISMYHGLLEYVPLFNTAEATENTGAVAPTVITVEQLLTNNYVSQLVKVENVAVETGATFTEGQTGSNVTFSQNGNEAVLRNGLKTLDMEIGDNTNWDITGFAVFYDDDIQIYPRGNDDVTLVTSIEELASEIAIYPNPTSDIVNIVTNGNAQRVEIANVDGQIVSNEVVSSDVVTISLEAQPAGMYFVRIYTANEIVVRKVTKF